MMRNLRNIFKHTGSLLAGLFVCLWPAFSVADRQAENDSRKLVVFPLHQGQVPGGLTFNLAGAETRTLKFQLAGPLSFNINNSLQKSSPATGSILLDSSLSLRVNNNVDITAGMGTSKNRPTFQSLGSIHCQNGVLEQGSYSASDCYFLKQADVLKQDKLSLGLSYADENFSTAVNLFKLNSSTGPQFPGAQSITGANPIMEASLIAPTQNNPLLPALAMGQSAARMSGEASGLDVEFQLGLSMDKAGDIRLGLQLTRVMDASFRTDPLGSNGPQSWAVSSPYDSAQLGVDWRKGNFSGGVKGFYRDQVEFLNRENLESVTTFDVHFTWRTPWNANLSVGTSNILNAGSEDRNSPDSALQDPFESIYGRIPYVRYQQDL